LGCGVDGVILRLDADNGHRIRTDRTHDHLADLQRGLDPGGEHDARGREGHLQRDERGQRREHHPARRHLREPSHHKPGLGGLLLRHLRQHERQLYGALRPAGLRQRGNARPEDENRRPHLGRARSQRGRERRREGIFRDNYRHIEYEYARSLFVKDVDLAHPTSHNWACQGPGLHHGRQGPHGLV
jgi:hypothetical protein